MNFAEELRLYNEVSKAAAYWQVEVYRYEGNLWETSRGNRLLKTWEKGDFNEAQKRALQLAKTGLVKVVLPYKGADNGYLLDNYYYLVDQPQGRALDLTNLLDLERAAKLLARLHKLALFEIHGNVLSIHIMPDSLYVGRYGELTLGAFENLRVENPLLSLAHLLYDCANEKTREFVLQKYKEVLPVNTTELVQAEQLIWDSAILLGQIGPKKDTVEPSLEKLQELMEMLWPLIATQEYSNLPVSELSVPVSEYLETQSILPAKSSVTENESVTLSKPEEIETSSLDALMPCPEEINYQGEAPEAFNDATSVDSELEASEKKLAVDEKTKPKETLAWKPFPKLPTRRW